MYYKVTHIENLPTISSQVKVTRWRYPVFFLFVLSNFITQEWKVTGL